MWNITTYEFERTAGIKTTNWDISNPDEEITIQLRQTSGTITVSKYMGSAHLPARHYYASGLMNLPFSVLDEWLIAIGAPSLSFIKNTAKKVDTPENCYTKEDTNVAGDDVRRIKRELEAINGLIKTIDIGVVYGCVERKPEESPRYFLFIDSGIPVKNDDDEGDDRSFKHSDPTARWGELAKRIGENVTIMVEFYFKTEESKKDTVYNAKMWLRKRYKC